MVYKFFKEVVKLAPSTDPRAVYNESVKHIPKKGIMLDVGCCGGNIGKRFFPNYEVIGLDFNKMYIEEAIKKGYQQGVMTDATAYLPFQDKMFDVVLATEIIEHMPDKSLEKMVSELRRVSKSHLIATVPNCDNIAEKVLHNVVFDRGYISDLDMGFHYQRFNPKSFKKTLEKAGFNILSMKKIFGGMDLLAIAEV